MSGKITLKVCHGHACLGNMSAYTFGRAVAETKAPEAGGESEDGKFVIEKCPCQSNCKKGPTVVVVQNGKEEIQSYVDPAKMGQLIKNLRNPKKRK